MSPPGEGTDSGLRIASDRMSVGEIVIAEAVARWQAPGQVTAYHESQTDDRKMSWRFPIGHFIQGGSSKEPVLHIILVSERQ